jgi:predicted RNA-binding protein with PIN domain
VADPTLYLFDGYNLLHAGGFGDVQELIDRLAGFVALQGVRGVVVFDGHGQERRVGELEVRHVANADALLERLAAEHRESESVCVVTSDAAVRGTSGQQVRKLSSRAFLRELPPEAHQERSPSRLADRLDEATRSKLERLRRGED